MGTIIREPHQRPTAEDLYSAVSVDLMRLAWMRYMAGLQSPAPTELRRFQRADSRVRYAVRSDLENQFSYLARCDAFRRLILEIGLGGFGEWITPGAEPGMMVFHDAVLEAVATAPLRGAATDPRFGRIEFLAAVKKIAGGSHEQA